ncbi:MAG: hypothetical protein MUF23_16310, partial [Pirellula sp.]|nr:hypothetical protein [Pirellula sp.]
MLRVLHLLFEFCCSKSTPSPLGLDAGGVTRGLSWLSATCLVLVYCLPARGQLIETFDGPQSRFTLWKDDARAVLTRPPSTEPGIESMEVQSGH